MPLFNCCAFLISKLHDTFSFELTKYFHYTDCEWFNQAVDQYHTSLTSAENTPLLPCTHLQGRAHCKNRKGGSSCLDYEF